MPEHPFLCMNFLSIFGYITMVIISVRIQIPCFYVVFHVNRENGIDDLISDPDIKDRIQNFNPAVQIPGHKIRTAHQEYLFSTIMEVVNTRMFKEPADDCADRDVV